MRGQFPPGPPCLYNFMRNNYQMTRIICVGSGKGGVGKTTTVANVSAALARLGKNVVAVDGNTTTGNLGLHLGIPLYPVTLQDVLKRKAGLGRAVYAHPAGFRVIPSSLSLTKLTLPKANSLMNVFYSLKSDFVIIDSAAGLGQEALAAVEAADELLTVVTPDLQSLTDALKLVKMARKLETKNAGVVINQIRNEKHEFSEDEVKDFMGGITILGKIPSEHHVRAATANRQPVVVYKPGSRAAVEFAAVASRLAGIAPEKSSVLARIFGWLR